MIEDANMFRASEEWCQDSRQVALFSEHLEAMTTPCYVEEQYKHWRGTGNHFYATVIHHYTTNIYFGTIQRLIPWEELQSRAQVPCASPVRKSRAHIPGAYPWRISLAHIPGASPWRISLAHLPGASPWRISLAYIPCVYRLRHFEDTGI